MKLTIAEIKPIEQKQDFCDFCGEPLYQIDKKTGLHYNAIVDEQGRLFCSTRCMELKKVN